MSSKINVLDIVGGHIGTLRDPKGRVLVGDFLTFYGAPFVLAVSSYLTGVNITSGVLSMLVNFGAIFTALLLSVLVLVYDQDSKISAQPASPSSNDKAKLLRDLYYNISYAVVLSVLLIFVCFVHSAVRLNVIEVEGFGYYFCTTYGRLLTSPISVFVTANIFLTILMIVKRMNVLLTTK